jgi:Zn-dependent peptidase ImmA (M78 family)
MNIKNAKAQAERLVERMGISSPPIDVVKIASKLDLPVIYANLGEGVSGLLISNGEDAHVCVQEKDPPKRQRFTVAHEIAHYYLKHQLEPGSHVHVDRGHYISERGPRASDGVDPMEIEANQFAASLLMPSKMVKRKVAELGVGVLLDNHVSWLAEEFKVSELAMTIRLTSLGLL